MNQKKNKKIVVILIIISIIIIISIGLAIMYFATDLFKSDEKLFFKYIYQMSDEKNGFINSDLKKYFEKKNNTPYEDDGSFDANVTQESGHGQSNNVDNFNITYSGQVDTANSKANQDISINYSNEVKFPFTYRQTGKTIGVQTKYVGNKFVAVEADKINDLLDETGTTSNSVVNTGEKIEEIRSVELSDEEINQIKEKYMNAINQKLQKSNFSKLQNGTEKGYKLSLSGDEMKTILLNILDTLKEDESTLNKLNEYIKIQKKSSKISKSDIENWITEINNNYDISDGKIEITVYTKNGKTSKLEILFSEEKTSDEIKMTIEKTQTGNDLQYNITINLSSNNEEILNVYLNCKYTGIQLLQSISENYELGINYKMQEENNNSQNSNDYRTDYNAKYTFNNNVNFIQSAEIEDLENKNANILNNYDKEQVSSFMEALINRIQAVNKKQMEQLGLGENENPIQYIIPNIMLSGNMFSTINASDLDESEISSFNKKFELYEGTNEKGVTVKGLLTVIKSNNDSNEKAKIEEINYNGQEYEVTEQNMTFIKGDIETEESYRVEFEKDQDTGIIYRAVINKK